MIKYKRGQYTRREAVFVLVNSSGVEQKSMNGVQKDDFSLSCSKTHTRKPSISRGMIIILFLALHVGLWLIYWYWRKTPSIKFILPD